MKIRPARYPLAITPHSDIWCQILSRPGKKGMRLMEILNFVDGSQITKLARLLPEGLAPNRDITAWACFTKLTACCFKWLIHSQVSLANYRWPCIYVCFCVRAHARVYNYGSPSAEREIFLFGKAICWNRPAPFILSIITMQEEQSGKMTSRKKRKAERDKWR